MAFQKSFQQTLNEYVKSLADLQAKFDTAAFKLAKKAAGISVKIMADLKFDPIILDMIKNIKVNLNGLNYFGKKISMQFKTAWIESITEVSSVLNRTSAVMSDMDRRIKKLAISDGVWTEAIKAQELENELREKGNNQISLNDVLIQNLTQAMSTASKTDQKILNEKIESLKQVNDELKNSIKNTEGLGKKMEELIKQEKLHAKMKKFHDRIYGPINKVKEQWEFVKYAGKEVMANPKLALGVMIAGLIAALGLLFDALKKVVGVFADAGQLPRQWATSVLLTQQASRKLFKEGLNVDVKELAIAVSQVQGQLGKIHIPRELSEETGRLFKQVSLSQETGAAFLTTMYRFNARNAEKAVGISNYVKAFAQKNDANAKALFETMAGSMDDFAASANMSADAFARAALDSQRVGYNLKSMTQLADRLVSDFEGALKTQAELSTVFPGMDLTQVMFASQYGSMDDVRSSVQDMLQQSGITQDKFKDMPRSFKLMLNRDLGLTPTEMVKMLGVGKREDYMTPDQKSQVDIQDNVLKSAFDLSRGGIGTIIKLLENILFALAPLTIISKIGRFTGHVLSAVTQDKQPGQIIGEYIARNPDKFSKPSAPVKKFHSGLMPNEFPAILQKGESVFTAKTMERVTNNIYNSSNLMSRLDNIYNSSTMINSQSQQIAQAPSQGFTIEKVIQNDKSSTTEKNSEKTTKSAPVDTKKIESLLQNLIAAVKETKHLNVDGKVLARALVESSTRNSG